MTLEVGSLIWRPIHVRPDLSIVPADIDFTLTDRGSWRVFAVEVSCVLQSYETDAIYDNGIVVPKQHFRARSGRNITAAVGFANVGTIPHDWTHFEVVGLSRSGTTLFLQPRVGTEADLRWFHKVPDPS